MKIIAPALLENIKRGRSYAGSHNLDVQNQVPQECHSVEVLLVEILDPKYM